LGIEFSSLEISTQDADNHIYTVKIASTDSPLLIGPHGRTLEETQSLLIQMAEKITGTHCIIHLEINDYLAEKQKRLMAIVDRKVELARKNGIDQVIYELSGYERKQVHAYISEKYPDIATKSIDGEKGRELHIMLRE
jgi:predicted RNA-binding protein Jag